MTQDANCLNLVGDGDDVDARRAVEQAFAVKLSDSEAQRCETVGQLFDLVLSKLNVSEKRNIGCPTAVAFFRLRAALRRLGCEQRLTHKTDLRAIFQVHGAKRLHLSLAREVDLDLPGLVLRSTSFAGLMLIMACGAALAVWATSWFPMLACTVLAVALSFVLPRTVPEETANFGDFTLNCAAWNYGKLSKRLGGARPRDVWEALTTVIRESTGTSSMGEMNYNTRFFAERRSSHQ